MLKRGSAVHVSTHRRHYVGKDGVERDYETHLLRRSYREDGKVKNETVANLSHLPADLIEMIRASLAGQAFVPAAAVATVARTRPHGHVAAVHAQAKANPAFTESICHYGRAVGEEQSSTNSLDKAIAYQVPAVETGLRQTAKQ